MGMNRRLNVSEWIDSGKVSKYQVMVILLCGFVAMMDGFDTQSIAFVAPVMAKLWGVDVNAFGPVFGIGLVGLMVGMLILGPAADRFGRRNVIMISVLIFALCSLFTVNADSIADLLLFRFLTGIGLGGAMPNILSLTAEYSPSRVRNTMVSVMFCGFPLGAVVGGLLSARIIPVFGWESVFYLGGIAPLALLPFLYLWLPESIRFLVHRKYDQTKISSILQRINPSQQIRKEDQYYLPEVKLSGFTVKHLFARGLANNTILLWILFFIILLVAYFLINWLPSILNKAGMPLNKAIIAVVLFNLGNIIGGTIICLFIDRTGNPKKVLSIALGIGALFVALVGFSGHSLLLLMFVIFLSGCFVQGSLLGITALGTTMYETDIRSTGIGWALGVGRIGSILGPVLGGMLLSLKWSDTTLFLACSIPVLAAALIILFLTNRSALN